MEVKASVHVNDTAKRPKRLTAIRLVAQDVSDERFLASLVDAISYGCKVSIETDEMTHDVVIEGEGIK